MSRAQAQSRSNYGYMEDVEKLLKKPGNNICADCKRKRPRWASWNLGIFICIQCAGVHRGMGTHISKVRSVDMDKWKEEESWKTMERWGNTRANMYWEAKLTPDHVPNERRLEDFIKPKYEQKRWALSASRPEPETLDDGRDEDVPLKVVQEKAKLARETSLRAASSSSRPVPPPPKATPLLDSFDDIPAPPVRPSTTDTPGMKIAPPKAAPPPRPAKAADSLLGLDIFGGPPPALAGRPSSSASTPSGPADSSQKDYKDRHANIMSLYAPKPNQSSFTGAQSVPIQQQPSGSSGLNDAFRDLNFNPPVSPPTQAPKPQQQPKMDPFANFGSATNQRSSVAPPQVTSPPMSGGGFFNTGPKVASKPSMASKPPQIPTPKTDPLASADFGDFSFAASSGPVASKPTTASASNDLFDFSEPPPPARAPQASAPAPQKSAAPAQTSKTASPFNLSAPINSPQSTMKPAAPNQPSSIGAPSGISNMDAWGSSDAWATPDPTPSISAPKPQPSVPAKAPSIPMSNDFSAWGGTTAPSSSQAYTSSNGFGSTSQTTPKIAPDEDFGGWSSAAPTASTTTNARPQQTKSSGGGNGFGGGDDLFSNVWE